MSNIAIKVEGLSKAYRIGLKEQKYDTLGGVIGSWIKSPVDNFKRLRKLSNFDFEKDEQDTYWALKDINFQIEAGEVMGIIGKNGAGKSTLLKILSRITEPSTGEIHIKGRIAALLEVGTGFNLELTGRENIFLNGSILGMTKKEIEKKFDEIIFFSGVETFIDTPVKRYSSGMRVRLGFAVAAYLEPEILIVDEVLAVGDMEFQKKCISKMQEVSNQDGRTVLFVSHDMSAVGNLCKKCIVLDKGKIDLISDTSAAIHKYTGNIHNTEFEKTNSKNVLLGIKEISESKIILNLNYHILDGELKGDLFIKILNGSNAELVLYKESNIIVNDKDHFLIEVDISSFKSGYYSVQSKLWAVNSNLKSFALNSDFIPLMVDKDTFNFPHGQIAPRIIIHKNSNK